MAQVALPASATWNGTTTVTISDTSGAGVDDFIRLKGDSGMFKITAVSDGVSYTITNPLALTIPSGTDTTFLVTDPELQALQIETDEQQDVPFDDIKTPELVAMQFELNAELILPAPGVGASRVGAGAPGSAACFPVAGVTKGPSSDEVCEIRKKLLEGEITESDSQSP